MFLIKEKINKKNIKRIILKYNSHKYTHQKIKINKKNVK